MKNIILIPMILLCTTAYAQQSPAQTLASLPGPKASQASSRKASPARHQKDAGRKAATGAEFAAPVSVQVLAGSQGLGADVRYGLMSKLSARLGFAAIPVNSSNPFTFSSFAVNDQFSAKFANVHLLADYSPFKSGKFRLVGGAGYLIRGNASVLITPAASYQFGNSTITRDQIGALTAQVYWKGIAPYLGVAFFRAFPNRFFNMNIDLGTYYLSRPGTSFTGTKMLSDNSSQEPQFNQNMQGYRWLPVIQLNFNFRIK